MKKYIFDNGSAVIDWQKGCIVSLCTEEGEMLETILPLFALKLRYDNRYAFTDTFAATTVTITENGAVYSGFAQGFTVTAEAKVIDGALQFFIRTDANGSSELIERIDYPQVCVKPFAKNGGNGRLLWSYNEGVITDDIRRHAYHEPEYPSLGSYAMFPNMLCTQFMCYLAEKTGLYFGMEDEKRGNKFLDFQAYGNGVALTFGWYTGSDRGDSIVCGFPVCVRSFKGDWQDGADCYRRWFEKHLPPRVRKIEENPHIPSWYADSPVVITYPVRGVHDMDKPEPNALFPYQNALPLLDEFRSRVGKLLILLMHWEGTAPWAPPYVWPPYGGEEMFSDFRDRLHEKGDLLGVYCSGFGYSLKSNINDYSREDEYEKRGLSDAMCAAPDGSIGISRICTAQRRGYDLCPASERGREILQEAYSPLFASGIDYAQILDQNHGGSQYFCYSTKHRHPQAPGDWMTTSMQKLLTEWNTAAPNTLFGCESAAGEPFMGNLLLSDNRYELNWRAGHPVPLYAYLFHEYLRNFMGNQVSCPFDIHEDTLRLRMAYSYAAGDLLTFALLPNGQFLPQWSCRDFSGLPDREKALTFAANLSKFGRGEAKDYLCFGKMKKPEAVDCPTVMFHAEGREVFEPSVYTSAWDCHGKSAQILVNHTDNPVTCKIGGKEYTVPALDAVLVSG